MRLISFVQLFDCGKPELCEYFRLNIALIIMYNVDCTDLCAAFYAKVSFIASFKVEYIIYIKESSLRFIIICLRVPINFIINKWHFEYYTYPNGVDLITVKYGEAIEEEALL